MRSLLLLAISGLLVLALSVLAPGGWSPYICGALIGLLSCLAFAVSSKGLGASTTYVRVSGFLARLFSPQWVDRNEYLREEGVKVEWQMMLLVGLFLGALVSAVAGRDFAIDWIPALWSAQLGSAVAPRITIAFVGGILVAVGGRWAGGCTSGHGITGALQMTAAGWIAAACFFIAGVATAGLLYGFGGEMP